MYQKKEKNKRISGNRSVLSAAVLMAFALMFVMLMVPVKTYAEEKASERNQDAGSGIKITVTGDVSAEPKKEETKETATETLPDIEIYIDVPEGYFSDRATVTFRLKTKDGSMHKIKNVKAKTGKKGTYQDVTSTMSLEITENCTVHTEYKPRAVQPYGS